MIDKRKDFTMGYRANCPYRPEVKTSLCEGVYMENGKEKICLWKIEDQKKCSLASEGTK